jgi:hypothetical protein
LQTSEGSDAVNGAVRLEAYAQLMADYSGRPANLSTQGQRTVVPLKFLFWWRLIDERFRIETSFRFGTGELMNVVFF